MKGKGKKRSAKAAHKSAPKKRASTVDGQAERRRVQKLPPDAPEAHDEGPRLIPFAGPSFNRAYAQEPSLPTDGYVALADKAMSMWRGREEGKKRTR
jgi:hypothetical protein